MDAAEFRDGNKTKLPGILLIPYKVLSQSSASSFKENTRRSQGFVKYNLDLCASTV